MSLKVMKGELQRTLDADCATFGAGTPCYRIGLYKNNHTPNTDTDSLSDYTPADFPGYSGLQNLDSWIASTWSTPRATATHPRITWTHSSSAGSNDIYGYYVVDESGNLAWAEKNPDGPITVSANGQTYYVDPVFTRRSEF